VAKPQRSLKSRALQLLAQRDQSRLELRRKLLRHVPSNQPAADAAQPAADAAGGGDHDPRAAAAEIEPLLDWLEANGFLSNERFAESRVHARQSRFGLLRIRNELGRHDVALPAELAQSLAESELERAAAVRARRFAALPADAGERASQSRFLLARGFAPEVVHRLMRSVGRGSAAPEAAANDIA
jgi:regulatory protein